MIDGSSIVVVGLGYVGLPTATAFATKGMQVVGVDIEPAVVDAVNNGMLPSGEPDLQIAVSGAVGLGRLRASREIPQADAYIIAVPTPIDADRHPDLRAVLQAASSIATCLRGGELVVMESTIPPGATRLVGELIASLRPDLSVGGVQIRAGTAPVEVAHCPERVLPGRIMIEVVTNDRVVGGLTTAAAERAAALYAVVSKGAIHTTTANTAELCKLAENAYRDVNIAFANELSVICERLGVDVWELIEMANHHPRVSILHPGPGVGGHCIAVDPWFMVSAAPEQARLIRTAREVNDAKPAWVVERVLFAAADLPERRIACLGLAFKANIDDLRESPAALIVESLVRALPAARFDCVEPNITALPGPLEGSERVTLAPDLHAAVRAADIVLLLVDHDEFRAVDPGQLIGKQVIDTRGMWHERRRSARTAPAVGQVTLASGASPVP